MNNYLIGSELNKYINQEIEEALNHYFTTDRGTLTTWSEDAIAENGLITHNANGSIEFHMGDDHLITFYGLEMKPEIMHNRVITLLRCEAERHYE